MLIPRADAGWVIVATAMAGHPLLSVAVIVYVPALSVALRLLPPPPLQEYVYGETPPVAVLAVTVPVSPLHNTLVTEEIPIPTEVAGWLMLPEAVAVHPLLS